MKFTLTFKPCGCEERTICVEQDDECSVKSLFSAAKRVLREKVPDWYPYAKLLDLVKTDVRLAKELGHIPLSYQEYVTVKL